MRLRAALITLLLAVSAYADEEIYFGKRLSFAHTEEAHGSLHHPALEPPVKLGATRDAIRAKFGTPKEIIGYGEEVYRMKDATVTVSYSSNSDGQAVATIVNYQPKKPTLWSKWVKPSVELPRPSYTDKKTLKLVRINLQVRIDKYAADQSLQITLMGTREHLTSAYWSLIL